jgi:integrase/recombinase XerD
MDQSWPELIRNFKAFLKLERSLSDNSIEAYIRDVKKLHEYLELSGDAILPGAIRSQHIKDFLEWIHHLGVSPRSQARMISGIKAFFKYLLVEDLMDSDPTALIEAPKVSRKLPDVLSVEEIDLIIQSIDLSKKEGQRNKAILETLYSCGLRVSELINLRLSNLFFKMGYLKVVGKGHKERLVPISDRAIKEIESYFEDRRRLKTIRKEDENVLFLSRNGRKMSRVMIFNIIRQLVDTSGIKKRISPHTFRHSFATHLIDGGADLRAVQEMLGHESIITTEIYTHLDRDYLRDTIIQFHPRS